MNAVLFFFFFFFFLFYSSEWEVELQILFLKGKLVCDLYALNRGLFSGLGNWIKCSVFTLPVWLLFFFFSDKCFVSADDI